MSCPDSDIFREIFYPDGTSALMHQRRQTLNEPSQTISQLRLYTDGLGALNALKVDTSTRGHVVPDIQNGARSEQVYPGLDHYLRIDHPKLPPTYVFDQHSLALLALAEALQEERLQPHAHFLNIDTHPDAREASVDLIDDATRQGQVTKTLPGTHEFAQAVGIDLAFEVYDVTAIDQFIAHALQLGFIRPPSYWLAPDFEACKNSPMERPSGISGRPGAFRREIRDPYGANRVMEYTIPPLQEVGWHAPIVQQLLDGKIPSNQFALSIDIDYFAKIDDKQRIHQEMELMRKLIKHAGVVMIATSPGFIDQDRAIQLTRQLLEPLYQETH